MLYYSNRAFVNIKLENYNSSIEDANIAINIDPNFYKSFYRRAEAYFSLNKFRESLKDYKFLKSIFPDIKDLDERIERIETLKKRADFFNAYTSKEI